VLTLKLSTLISLPQKNVALKKGDWLKDGGKRMGREKKRWGMGTS
jgi:hypothetical protein